VVANVKSIIMVHQGFELYGSDRSFISSVSVLVKKFDVSIVIPEEGKIVKWLKPLSGSIIFRPNGYLRKAYLKRKPISTIFKMLSEIKYFLREFKKYEVIYINTIVCFSAIVACFFIKDREKYIHIREIPPKNIILFFRLLLILSGAKLIFNSKATATSFSLSGSVILNGVPAIDSKENELGLENREQLKILIIGRINSWKGQEFFIRSILNYKKPILVRVVGDVFDGQKYFLDELKAFVVSEKLNVEFYGFSENPSVHYNWADYVVVPSIAPEPFGRVAIEAMSCSTPVIASNHGGLSEIVTHGVDGMLFEPRNEDSLLSVLNELPAVNTTEYMSLSSSAYKKYSSHFSESAYQLKLLNLIVNKD